MNCLTGDKELPVKVEAAVALQYLIKHQTVAETCIQPFVKLIIKSMGWVGYEGVRWGVGYEGGGQCACVCRYGGGERNVVVGVGER